MERLEGTIEPVCEIVLKLKTKSIMFKTFHAGMEPTEPFEKFE